MATTPPIKLDVEVTLRMESLATTSKHLTRIYNAATRDRFPDEELRESLDILGSLIQQINDAVEKIEGVNNA